MHSHFELFGLAPAYALEAEALERSYREIQSRVHPDRFARRRRRRAPASLHWTTRVNEAAHSRTGAARKASARAPRRRWPSRPTPRCRATSSRSRWSCANRWRRRRRSRLGSVAQNLRKTADLEKAIAEAIDAKDYAGAAELVRKLQFLDKLDAEIDAAYETIE